MYKRTCGWKVNVKAGSVGIGSQRITGVPCFEKAPVVVSQRRGDQGISTVAGYTVLGTMEAYCLERQELSLA